MAGELVIRKGGYFGVEDSSDDDMAEEQGKGQVFTDNADECCCCDPCENADPKPNKILTSWTSRRDYSPKDLRPYRKKGECFKYWRIAEGDITYDANGCYVRSSGSQYESGSIENGELVGLPDEWKSNYSYEGHMKLSVHCCLG